MTSRILYPPLFFQRIEGLRRLRVSEDVMLGDDAEHFHGVTDPVEQW